MEILTSGVLASLNYWAVIVVALVSFFAGGLWYSPALFEDAWTTANGYTDDQVKDIQRQLGAPGFALTFLANAAMAFILAILSRVVGTDSIGDGVVVAVLVWLGFVASFSLAVNLFSTRSINAWILDAGYHLVVLVIGGIVFAVWQ